MKITQSTLRKIIREELEAAMNEANDGFQIGSIKGGFSKEFGSRLQQMLAIKADLKKNLEREPTPEELRKAMRAAGMRDPGEEAPMEEAADDRAMENADLVNMLSDKGIISLSAWKSADKGARRRALMRLRGAYGDTATKLRAAVKDNRNQVKALLDLR